MNRTQGQIFIKAPVDVVFNYICTPATWPEWYPITRGVSGNTARPGQPGDEWQERVSFAGIPFTFYWKTLANGFPNAYDYEGTSNAGGGARIHYDFTAQNGGTVFKRELVWWQTTWIGRVSEVLFGKRLICRASSRALENARRVLESRPTAEQRVLQEP